MHVDNVPRFLEFYVLAEDFNKSTTRMINIFQHSYIRERIPVLVNQYKNMELFKKELLELFKYCYKSKREYEIFVYVRDKANKVDIYSQIEPNIDLIGRYIIEMYNKVKRKKIIL